MIFIFLKNQAMTNLIKSFQKISIDAIYLMVFCLMSDLLSLIQTNISGCEMQKDNVFTKQYVKYELISKLYF